MPEFAFSVGGGSALSEKGEIVRRESGLEQQYPINTAHQAQPVRKAGRSDNRRAHSSGGQRPHCGPGQVWLHTGPAVDRKLPEAARLAQAPCQRRDVKGGGEQNFSFFRLVMCGINTEYLRRPGSPVLQDAG